jgi:hypothetical protein
MINNSLLLNCEFPDIAQNCPNEKRYDRFSDLPIIKRSPRLKDFIEEDEWMQGIIRSF